MTERFTIDGSDGLEQHLRTVCEQVAQAVLHLVGADRLDALVLGGGYGRGEGGVLRTSKADLPYNDLEFYVFLHGNRLLNERRFREGLVRLGDSLSERAGLHVEFKIESLRRLRTSPVTMFTYDLLSGHKVVLGNPHLFTGCEQHLEAAAVPAEEATRLLFNRCSGLLIARELSRKDGLTVEDADFVERNLAKARLALGDAVLTLHQQYHWSARERHARLAALRSSSDLPFLNSVLQQHRDGLMFKLHPARAECLTSDTPQRLAETIETARQVWLWAESRRLGKQFSSTRDYALCRKVKCQGQPGWRNYLLSLRTFGLGAALALSSRRYPRERLYNALALLLWDEEPMQNPDSRSHLRDQLLVRVPEWNQCLRAYQKAWAAYG